MSELTPTTQLAILLSGRWAVTNAKPLSNSEFAEIRRALGPGQNGANALLEGRFDLTQISLDQTRVSELLSRGLGLFQSVDRWMQAGIWIVSWADFSYPERFKQLKQRAPVLLFGYGNPNAFSHQALAIVGSRNASPDRLNMAAEIGRACSASQITVVSGGARGIDSYAMNAGIVGKGTVVGVLADSLLKESGKKLHRDAIREGRMCLMSEVHPEARFEIGNAMARNRLAYACADAALVVECEPNKGGTWAGALEALKEGKAVYVLRGAIAERELTERGAIRIDMSFALNPSKLIRSERPPIEVPQTVRIVETIQRLLGNPTRTTSELTKYFEANAAVVVEQLMDAALSDGLVEKFVAEKGLSPKSENPRKKQRKKPQTEKLFDV
jgi:predicted Rossmann fold nucleotide-binding protein DprA/Smf involved in DNA uptake